MAHDRLFRPRRTAIADGWKLDAVGEQVRAVESTGPGTKPNPCRSTPSLRACANNYRERIQASDLGDTGEGDRSVPERVEANLRNLGYR